MTKNWLWAIGALLCLAACDDGGGGAGGEGGAGGADRDGAAGECLDGERRCSGADVQVCSGAAWVALSTCPAGQQCELGECIVPECEPDCAGKQCGDDGCGETCGECADSACVDGQCVAAAACGDDACDPGEDCEGCPDDCGCAEGQICEARVCVAAPCEPACGDAVCGSDGCGGSCGDCAEGQRCVEGACSDLPSECGDDVCDGDESCLNCPADCGVCCGDGACTADHGEDCATCLADCGCAEADRCDAESRTCVPACAADCAGKVCGGDGCGGSCGDCADDQRCDLAGRCVDPPPGCGNDACDVGEDCLTCPADCGVCCGNGACAGDENCATCPADCLCDAGERCDVPARMCVAECVRDCDQRRCGPDGCGGQCGMCAAGELCDPEAGTCDVVCQANCNGRACGPDGCGGVCGMCAAGSSCVAGGQCQVDCVPDCADAECGDDGCGGDCGQCAANADCNGGVCVPRCVPDCAGRACGDNGCGGVCGLCDDAERCSEAGQCVRQNVACDCAPNELCVDGQCRGPDQVCGQDNPHGLCPNGTDCIAGACVDNGAACSNQNPAGVCAAGQVCRNGACAEFDGAALCDDLNPCTLDFFDGFRNACVNAPHGADCSDGNGCTVNRCDDGVCLAAPIAGCVEPPTIGPFDSPTNVGVLNLTGSKPAGSAVEINGQEAVPESPDENWAVRLNLVPGDNVYRIRSRDRDNASAVIEIHVFYDITPPITTSTPDGGVFLNGLTVTVASNEPATVYYTTDGGEPDRWSDAFQSARTFRIFDDTVLKFRARDAAGNWEEAVRTATFEISGHANGWAHLSTLPEPLIHAGAYAEGTRVWVIGGSDGLASQAGCALYDMDGDAWSNLPALPSGRSQLAVAAAGGFIYAFGGEDDGLPLNTVNRLSMANPEGWGARRAMPSTRFGMQAVQDGGSVYVLGGKTNGGVVLDTHEVYNVAADTWRNDVAQMPRPRYAFAAILYQGQIYVFGGEDEDGRPIPEVDVYTIVSNSWRQIANLPTPRSFLAGSLVRNVGAVAGGSHGILAAGGRTLGGDATAVVEEYVIELDEWRQRTPMSRPRHSAAWSNHTAAGPLESEARALVIGGSVGVGNPQLTADLDYFVRDQDYLRRLAPLPEGRFMHAAVSLGNRIYLFGGRNFQETLAGWAFDPETETYTPIADLPSPQNGLAAVGYDGRVWALGGANAFGNAVPTARSYDPVRDEWTDHRPMLNARRDAYATVVDDRIYVVGGDNNGAVQSVEIYNPETDRWENGPLLPEARAGATGVTNDGVITLIGGRNADGAPRPGILSLANGAWAARGLAIDVTDATAVVIGDLRATVLGGRAGGRPTATILPWRLSDQQLYDNIVAGTNTLAALDSSATVEHNGEIYVFGGNATPEIGPDGSTLVQKLRGTCFNGVVDRYEDPPEQEQTKDSGGGCLTHPLIFRPPAVGTSGRQGVAQGDPWRVCRADDRTAWVSANTGGTYNAVVVCQFLGYSGVNAQGGTSGRVCASESYDGGGGSITAIRTTVHWRCFR